MLLPGRFVFNRYHVHGGTIETTDTVNHSDRSGFGSTLFHHNFKAGLLLSAPTANQVIGNGDLVSPGTRGLTELKGEQRQAWLITILLFLLL